MIPISNDRTSSKARPESASRTESPAAPTPPPKPQLPQGCQDWDSYLTQKKSTATLPHYDNEEPLQENSLRIQSPELNFKHSFENLGWRDCLTTQQRPRGYATTTTANTTKTLRRRPSVATVIGTYHLGSSTASLRSAKRLSNASTLTTHTAATVPCILSSSSSSSRAYKRLSNASTLTTATTATFSSISSSGSGKPRSLRRIHRTRHLRAYYSDGSLLRTTRRLSVGISSMQDITERREPSPVDIVGGGVGVVPRTKKRLSSASMLSGECLAPPPYPPPEKPLPSLPVIEVRELQTKERTRWRELLLRNFPRRDVGSWSRRTHAVSVR